MFSDSGTFSLSSLNLTSDTISNLTTSGALQYLKDTVDEDYAKAVAYALVNVAAQKAFQTLGSLDLFDWFLNEQLFAKFDSDVLSWKNNQN